MLTIRQLFKGLYRRCGCGRYNCLIPIIKVDGGFSKFREGHNNYKGGRYKVRDYWYLYIPDYFSANTNGTVREHVYNFQESHKCCMLKWGVVHHIIPVKKGGSNMPWNLEGMMRRDHQSLHFKGKHKNVSDRKCLLCGSNKTYFRKDNNLYIWFRYKNGYICDV